MNRNFLISRKFLIHTATILAGTITLLLAGCSSNEAKLASHLQKANELFANDDYSTAEIEYLNVLQIDEQSIDAISRLGIIYYDQVRLRKAFPYLARASEVDPSNSEVRYRLGFLYLVSGEAANARKQAEDIIIADPNNLHAPILLANTATNPEEMEAGIRQLQSLQENVPSNPSIHVGIAILQGRTQKPDLAKESIQRALDLDSKSHYAHLVSRGLYLSDGNQNEALESLKKAAEYSPLRSANKVDLAQQYLGAGDKEAYRLIIEPLLKKAPKFVPALLLSAKFQASENQLPEARKRIDSVLALDSTNHDAIALSGNLFLADREVSEALEVFEQGVQFFPQSPVAHFNLARASLADNRAAEARNSLMKTLSLNPDYPEAMALMANFQLQSGEYSSAEVNIMKLLARSPEDLGLKLQLAAIKRGQGSPEEAIAIYNELEAAHPENAQLPLLRAQLYAQQDNSTESKKAIEKALERDPDHLLALDLLTSFLISEERHSFALEQVSTRIERNPEIAGYYLIEAKIHVAQEDFDKAEELLLKAIDLDPDNRTPYMILSQVYVRDEKREAALERLQQVVSKNPEDISALMIMCGIYEYEKQFENARYTYEKILKVNPNFPPALNNLAYLYSEKFDQQDNAYEYANRARNLLPHDPAIADTLGWILFKRGDIEWARGLIQESAEKLPDNAEVRYHLGMTYYMLGDEGTAKEHFIKALSFAGDFNGKDDLEERLSILEIGSSSKSMLAVSDLEKRANSSEKDPVLLSRLAQAYENSGEIGNALKTYEKIITLNSNNVPAILKTASLQFGEDNSKAAFELSKEAYKIEPNNPEVSAQLGKLAFVEGDYEWSTSLLQTSARNKPGDPEILFDLSLSLISVGKVEEAQEQLAAIPAGEQTAAASHLSEFLKAIDSNRADEILQNANALKVDLISGWSEAAIARIEQENEKAQDLYNALLASFPNFTIAKRELTFIHAQMGEYSEEVIRMAAEAKRAYPEDTALAEAAEAIQKQKEEAESVKN